MSRLIKHIFLDLDGTLFQSAVDIRNAWISTLTDLQIPCPHFDKCFRVGPSLDTMLHMLFPEIDIETEKKVTSLFKRHYDASDLPNTIPYPGINEWLQELHAHGYKLSTMTNKRLKPTRMLLARSNWTDYFDRILGSDSFDIQHPTKSLLLDAAIKEFSLSPQESIMVGDTAEDIKAGQSAGCRTCFCTWGYGDRAEITPLRPDIQLELSSLSNFRNFTEGEV